MSGDYLTTHTAAEAWRLVGQPTGPRADGSVAGCVLEAGVESKHCTIRLETGHHAGLDRALDLILTETIIYNPWLCVWPAVSPRPEFPDNYVRLDVDLAAGVGAIRYTIDRDGLAGSWLTKVAAPVAGVDLSWDYHNRGEARFPDDAVLALPLWRQALHEYLDLHGGRPRCVDWQPTEFRW
jgi:Immunity protein Imm1